MISLKARHRFIKNIEILPGHNECHIYKGTIQANGYGTIIVQGKHYPAHRLAYQLFIGPIPPGKFVLHHCDVRCCVNTAHLFVGTHTDNMQDAARKNRIDTKNDHQKKTHCPNGHEYRGNNLLFYKGWRYCRACRDKRNRMRG